MGELKKYKVKEGSHVVIRDPKDDYKITHEGDVIDFLEIVGTNRTRIILDPPLWIECTKVD